MQNPSDHERQLLARCREGDLEALGQIYAHYEAHIYRYAYHMLGNADDAHDLRQETFLRAFRGITKFRGDCSVKTWLLTICTNLCRRHLSARRRYLFNVQQAMGDTTGTHPFLLGDSGPGDPLAVIERSMTADIILQALRSLPPNQREVIILREIEEMSYDQISEVLGCTRGSVNAILFRARRRFIERAEALLKETE
jgi:RNA polymerase sigma-70 factor (ECF subfamily)